jgi:hypothetical protein
MSTIMLSMITMLQYIILCEVIGFTWQEIGMIFEKFSLIKACHLLWRLRRGCLPTRQRLLQRHVECKLSCPMCVDMVEDELHVFFDCATARAKWEAIGLLPVLQNATYQ